MDLQHAAARAAELYGQNFDNLPAHSQSRWVDLVQSCSANPGDAGVAADEVAAHTAYREELEYDIAEKARADKEAHAARVASTKAQEKAAEDARLARIAEAKAKLDEEAKAPRKAEKVEGAPAFIPPSHRTAPAKNIFDPTDPKPKK